MLVLDCEDATTALQSLATAAGVDVVRLRRVLLSHDPDQIGEFGDEDLWVDAPHALFAEAGVDIAKVSFDAGYYFHGSRVLNPHSFLSGGVLPLGSMLTALNIQVIYPVIEWYRRGLVSVE